MSQQTSDGQGLAGLPRRLADWVRSIGQSGSTPQPAYESLDSQTAADLFQRAAQCYARAGWADDAVRLFGQLGDDRQAAPYYERSGQWESAAAAYTRLSDWANAARCYLEAGQPNEGAESLLKAGHPIQAAWLWADQAHHFRRAEATVAEIVPATEADQIAVALIRARCETGLGATTAAARRLSRAIGQLDSLLPDVQRRRMYEWAHTVAGLLRRPDLSVLIHVSARAAGLPGAQAEWEEWATQTLGVANSVPELPFGKPLA